MKNASKLRLLIAGTYPPPFGGIATHLTSLIPGLKEKGVENIIVVSFKDKNEVIQKEGFTLYSFNVRDHFWKIINPLNLKIVWLSFLILSRYKLKTKNILIESIKAILINTVAKKYNSNVISFYQSNLNLQILTLKKIWNKSRAIVLTVFGEYYEEKAFLTDHTELFKSVLSVPDHVTSSSKHCANSFKHLGVTRNIDPVYYGVNLEDVVSLELRQSFHQKYNISNNDTVLLFMGRFSVEMGFDVVLETANLLLSNNSSIKFILAGQKAELSNEAESLAKKYPKNIIILNNVPFAMQKEIFSSSDVLLAPTFNQRACMGMAIKEAMAACLPVIGSNGGGIPEAVKDNETGFLINLNEGGVLDKKQFINCIKIFIDDPNRRKNMGASGRERAENVFSVEKTNQRMMDIFLDVIPQ